jgi:hypothetical protein
VLGMRVSSWRRLGEQSGQVTFTALFALLLGGHEPFALRHEELTARTRAVARSLLEAQAQPGPGQIPASFRDDYARLLRLVGSASRQLADLAADPPTPGILHPAAGLQGDLERQAARLREHDADAGKPAQRLCLLTEVMLREVTIRAALRHMRCVAIVGQGNSTADLATAHAVGQGRLTQLSGSGRSSGSATQSMMSFSPIAAAIQKAGMLATT